MASSPSLGRGGREKCWEAKEKYFKCLDNGDECAQSQNEFFALCPSSWVSERFIVNKFK